MQQTLRVRNFVDEHGNPGGGFVQGVGINIGWQDGPLGTAEPVFIQGGLKPDAPGHNGAFVEGVIQACVERLKYYQSSKFACTENAIALTNLEQALASLNARTKRRVSEGTEGTHQGN